MDLGIKYLREEAGKKALDYLHNERGLSDETISDFQIGYCPEKAKHQLAGRIITPICDAFGEVVAISTRRMEKDHSFRFWHEQYEKGFYVYGLHLAKRHIIKYRKAILVEGEFDVACLHSQGIKMTIGLCGSALSSFQASMILRYCSIIYLLFDPDRGGRSATQRAMNLYKLISPMVSSSNPIMFVPVILPDGLDPDDFVKQHGKKALADLMKKSQEESNIFKS